MITSGPILDFWAYFVTYVSPAQSPMEEDERQQDVAVIAEPRERAIAVRQG